MIHCTNQELAKNYKNIMGYSFHLSKLDINIVSKKIRELEINISAYFQEHGNLDGLVGIGKRVKGRLIPILEKGVDEAISYRIKSREKYIEMTQW